MDTIVSRRFEWDAAHRVLGHGGKCRHLHGHRYRADVAVTAPELDGLSRVVDFGVIKARLGPWIDDNWDHNILLNVDDPLAKLYLSGDPITRDQVFGGRQPYFFQGDNPTAEVIAAALYSVAVNLLPVGLKVFSVTVYETPNCHAVHTGRGEGPPAAECRGSPVTEGF